MFSSHDVMHSYSILRDDTGWFGSLHNFISSFPIHKGLMNSLGFKVLFGTMIAEISADRR